MAKSEQDDIDKLLNEALGAGAVPASPAPVGTTPPPSPANQDDIAALLAEIADKGGETAPPPAASAASSQEPPADDLDALLRDMAEQTPPSPPPPAAPPPTPEQEAKPSVLESAPRPEAAETRLDPRLKIEAPAAEKEMPEPEQPKEAEVQTPPPPPSPAAVAVSPPSPVEPVVPVAPEGAAAVSPPPRAQLRSEEKDVLADVATTQPQAAKETPPSPAVAPATASALPLASIRESLSLLETAGEVEGVAGQIASLLGQLAERARRFQTAWLASDQEAKELRTRLAAEEHRRLVLESERRALQEEVETLRKRLAAVEAEKLANQEAARTEIAGLQMRQREQETRIGLLESQIRSLEEEMNRARSEATSADLESRRARFEADRLRAEIESERMERMRLQRALDNREKELQAIQAQTAGQASSLFLDELHRLVRRLERELDLRTSAAHEALVALDRLQVAEEMTPVISVLRAALLTAAGQEVEESDALRKLTAEVDKAAPASAGGVVSPVERNIGAFEVSLAALDLSHAREIAAELMKEGRACPAHLMSKIYLSPGLRREEVRSRLADVINLLRDVRQAQDAADKARGRQAADTEQLYAQMFDYLHNLVRLKMLTRGDSSAWEFFLDLRGRYSFITSDKQWQEYRDRVLKR